ncbi:MAG TPA: hopanoid-associated sugar epimerase [Chthonomonadaceae bacterium]|nr:hopanoid-associated sugar epimerase [Chthonomonadaceae bacterium]
MDYPEMPSGPRFPEFPGAVPARVPDRADPGPERRVGRIEFAPLADAQQSADDGGGRAARRMPVVGGLALITGATGFVGCHVARRLAAEGSQIRILARPGSRRGNLADLPAGRTEIVEGDLTDRSSLRAALDGCARLYHVAADYRLWSRDPRELYRANVDGTRDLLQAAVDAGVRSVVYTSTVGALGIPHDGSPGSEETPVRESDMIGHYKRSKFLAEAEAARFAAGGLALVIVNPSTPVGENDIKPTPTGRIIVDFLNRRLPAYVDTGLNLIDVRDVAAGIVLAGERGRVGQRYILGSRNTTLKAMLDMLASITGVPAPAVRLPYAVAWAAVGIENLIVDRLLRREPAHPFEGVKMARHKMYFDPSKAVRELGLPQSPVEDALRRAVDWFRANGYVGDRC